LQLDQITFTRFIAALTVVFFHYGQNIFPANISFLFENITAGPIAVGYFYVLSGFIMAIAYYQADPNKQIPISKKKYWVARFARIYPVYLLALLIIVAAKYKTLADDWATLPLHLFLLQSWIPGYPITLNTPGWSLSVEAFFYLCFPFLLFWIYKYKAKSLVIFSIIFWIATQFVLLNLLNSDAYAPKTKLHGFDSSSVQETRNNRIRTSLVKDEDITCWSPYDWRTRLSQFPNERISAKMTREKRFPLN